MPLILRGKSQREDFFKRSSKSFAPKSHLRILWECYCCGAIIASMEEGGMRDYEVQVVSKSGKSLMPTKRFGKVRRLLKENKAKVIRRKPFTIQLLYETTEYTQPKRREKRPLEGRSSHG